MQQQTNTPSAESFILGAYLNAQGLKLLYKQAVLLHPSTPSVNLFQGCNFFTASYKSLTNKTSKWGVGFLVNKRINIIKYHIPDTKTLEGRALAIDMPNGNSLFRFVVVYAPSSAKGHKAYFQSLRTWIHGLTPHSDRLIIGGDFNARFDSSDIGTVQIGISKDQNRPYILKLPGRVL